MKVLITGGAGFIGSTIASACEDSGIEPIILDDLSKGLRTFAQRYPFYEGDIADRDLLRKIFAEHQIAAVVHCAAKIVVPESMEQPLAYYHNNVGKSVVLLEEMLAAGVNAFLLSSTASMYATTQELLVDETAAVDPLSPYAASKWLLERVMADTAKATDLKALALRYFNPIGSDPQLRTGLQDPSPSHALGQLISRYRAGQAFTLTGTQWPTRDGSGLRDYIHVWDLALAHVAALRYLTVMESNFDVINLGTGEGTTVRELIAAFNEAVGGQIEVVEAPPRPGDVAGCATKTDKAAQLLNWRAQRSLVQGVQDAIAWAEKLPAELAAQ